MSHLNIGSHNLDRHGRTPTPAIGNALKRHLNLKKSQLKTPFPPLSVTIRRKKRGKHYNHRKLTLPSLVTSTQRQSSQSSLKSYNSNDDDASLSSTKKSIMSKVSQRATPRNCMLPGSSVKSEKNMNNTNSNNNSGYFSLSGISESNSIKRRRSSFTSDIDDFGDDNFGDGRSSPTSVGGGSGMLDSTKSLQGSMNRTSSFRRRQPKESVLSSQPARDDSIIVDRLDIRFAETEKVYGREQEIQQLHYAYQSISNSSSSSSSTNFSNDKQQEDPGVTMVLISGYTGTGKSTIVKKFHKELLEQRKATRRRSNPDQQKQEQEHEQREQQSSHTFFFGSGKFDLHQYRAEPYTAIVSAFSQLCKDIQALNNNNSCVADKEEFQQLRKVIQDAVGNSKDNVTMLLEIMPDLYTLLALEEESNQNHNQHQDYRERLIGTQSVMTNNHQHQHPSRETAEEEQAPHKPMICTERMKKRFIYIFRRFVRAVCNPKRPFILYLDDLQWADIASLELLEYLLTDPDLKGLLIVGCYRHNEVDDEHPMSTILGKFEQQFEHQHQDQNQRPPTQLRLNRSNSKLGSGHVCSNGNRQNFTIQRIQVGNLDKDVLHQLVSDVLDHSKSETKVLCNILYQRTHGNIFFAIQLLKLLQEENVLTYNFGTFRWQWDEDNIRHNPITTISDNVIDLLQNKFKNISPKQVRDVLQIAACLGSEFKKSTAQLVVRSVLTDQHVEFELEEEEQDNVSSPSTNMIDECFQTAVKEGLLIDRDGETFLFAHDQIQLAAYSLVPDEDRELLNLKIGYSLMDNLGDGSVTTNTASARGANKIIDGELFVITDLLNSGSGLITEDSERYRLSKLNLRAGRKAMESSAFASAAMYTSKGISLLGPKHWEVEPKLSLDLYNTAISAELCDSNNEKAQFYIDKVLELHHDDIAFKETLVAYSSLVELLGCTGRVHEAIDVALDILSRLGVSLSAPLGRGSVAFQILKTKRLLDGYGDVSKMADLPLLSSGTGPTAMYFMNKIANYAYDTNQNLMRVTVCEMVQYSVKHGVCIGSPLAFAYYGILVQVTFGDFRNSRKLSDLALSLNARLGDKDSLSAVSFLSSAFIRPWTELFTICRKQYVNAYHEGLLAGDHENAILNIFFRLLAGWYTGEPLTKLESDFYTYTNQMRDLGQTRILEKALIPYQSVLNMLGKSSDPTVLTGEAMNQDEVMQRCRATKNKHMEDLLTLSRLSVSFYFDFDLSASLVSEMENVYKRLPAAPSLMRYALFEGLAAFQMIRKYGGNRLTTNPIACMKWKRKASKVIQRVRSWVQKGNANCIHVLHLLEAEQLCVAGEVSNAKQKYDLAISNAARHGFRNDRALANELVGQMLLEEGEVERSSDYLKCAYFLYLEWEAFAKADQFYQKYSQHL